MTARMNPDVMEDDAAAIVGPELAAALRDRFEQLRGKQRAAGLEEEDAVELIYRSLSDIMRASVPTHKGRAVETTSWDGPAADKRARSFSMDGDEMDWGKYRSFFATYDPDNAETLGAYGFIHHDVDDDGMFLDLEGMVTAGAAASGARSGEENADAKKHLAPHYAQFDRTPPWERDRSVMRHRLEDLADLDVLARAGLIQADRVEAARDALLADLEAGAITDMDGVAIVAEDGSQVLRSEKGGLSLTLPQPSAETVAQRAGRRLQAKRLDQLAGLAETLKDDAASGIEDLLTWARDNADEANRSAAALLPDATVEPSSSLLERMDYGPEADASLVGTMEFQSVMDTLYRATFVLSDIIAANLNPEHEELTLEERMQNVDGAVREYLQVVNSLIVGVFGGGRSAPADNRAEVKTEGSAPPVKPAGGGTGTVNPPGEGQRTPDLSRLDTALNVLRQKVLDGAPVAELQEALAEEADALNELLPSPDELPAASEEVIERVARLEVGVESVRTAIEELLQRSQPQAPAPESSRLMPRRRSLPPGPAPAQPRSTSPAPAIDLTPPKRKTFSIDELARRSVEDTFPVSYP